MQEAEKQNFFQLVLNKISTYGVLIYMEILRITLSGIMALLVSLPMCVCGSSFLASSSEKEASCCPYQHDEENEDCETCYHDQIQYFVVNSNPTDQKVSNSDLDVSCSIFSENIFSGFYALKNISSREPPPDIFSHSSRNVTYCIYRL